MTKQFSKFSSKSKTNTLSDNYTIEIQKITFDFLKSNVWNVAEILRRSLDASKYKQAVMALLFLKHLIGTFGENAEKMIKEGKNEKDNFEN